MTAAKKNNNPTLRKKEKNKKEQNLPQHPGNLGKKPRGPQKKVSPEIRNRKGVNLKRLSPNRSLSQNAADEA